MCDEAGDTVRDAAYELLEACRAVLAECDMFGNPQHADGCTCGICRLRYAVAMAEAH